MPVDLRLEDLEPTDRLEVLAGRMRHAPVPLELRPLQPLDVRATTRVADFGLVHLLSTEATGAWVCRTTRLSRDDTEPQVLVSVLERGASSVASRRGAVTVRPGDVVVSSTQVPYAVAFRGTLRHTFSVPCASLGLPRGVIHAALGQPLGPSHPVAPAVGAFLTQLAQPPRSATTPPGRALQEPVVSLFRALLATSAGDEFRARRPLAETVGLRAEQYIRCHFADPALTAARVAAVHGISVRYLYRLLSDVGISPAGLIRDLRLDACARALSGSSTRVSAIAFGHGFRDQAHFTRAFKQRFGCTPTEWRRRHGQHDEQDRQELS